MCGCGANSSSGSQSEGDPSMISAPDIWLQISGSRYLAPGDSLNECARYLAPDIWLQDICMLMHCHSTRIQFFYGFSTSYLGLAMLGTRRTQKVSHKQLENTTRIQGSPSPRGYARNLKIQRAFSALGVLASTVQLFFKLIKFIPEPLLFLCEDFANSFAAAGTSLSSSSGVLELDIGSVVIIR